MIRLQEYRVSFLVTYINMLIIFFMYFDTASVSATSLQIHVFTHRNYTQAQYISFHILIQYLVSVMNFCPKSFIGGVSKLINVNLIYLSCLHEDTQDNAAYADMFLLTFITILIWFNFLISSFLPVSNPEKSWFPQKDYSLWDVLNVFHLGCKMRSILVAYYIIKISYSKSIQYIPHGDKYPP